MTSPRHGVQKDGQYTLVPLSAVDAAAAPAEVVPAEPTSQTILAAFIDWHTQVFGVRLPQKQCGRLAREIKRCLAEDYPVNSIKMGMCAWCSYLVEDPTKPPPALDTVVYCMLMKQRGHHEFMARALSTAGLPKRGAKQTSADIAEQNRQVLRRRVLAAEQGRRRA